MNVVLLALGVVPICRKTSSSSGSASNTAYPFFASVSSSHTNRALSTEHGEDCPSTRRFLGWGAITNGRVPLATRPLASTTRTWAFPVRGASVGILTLYVCSVPAPDSLARGHQFSPPSYVSSATAGVSIPSTISSVLCPGTKTIPSAGATTLGSTLSKYHVRTYPCLPATSLPTTFTNTLGEPLSSAGVRVTCSMLFRVSTPLEAKSSTWPLVGLHTQGKKLASPTDSERSRLFTRAFCP